MKKIRNIIMVIALLPVLAVLVPFLVVIGLPALGVYQLRSNLALRAFRRREQGTVYLICTSRRGWHDFLKNNVIPVLPDNFHVVWQKQGRMKAAPAVFAHLATSHIFAATRPYLVAVTPGRLAHMSINSILIDLKPQAAKSKATQAECVRRILNIEAELRTTASMLSARARASA